MRVHVFTETEDGKRLLPSAAPRNQRLKSDLSPAPSVWRILVGLGGSSED
jgi:hypothetical protein